MKTTIENKILLKEIESAKQDNGLWGMPLSVWKEDRIIQTPYEIQVLRSAILIALAELYHDAQFEIGFSSATGFLLTMNRSGKKENSYVSFEDYVLEENKLYFIGHESKLRKEKA